MGEVRWVLSVCVMQLDVSCTSRSLALALCSKCVWESEIVLWVGLLVAGEEAS